MGWLTVHALRVDRARSLAQAKAALEQNVSLALWRMDTKLAPLIAEEATRPHELYDSFITVSTPATKGGASSELVPSPLLTKAPDNVILNFKCPTFGEWSSPQAPPSEQLDLAGENGLPAAAAESNRKKLDQLAVVCDVSKLIAELPTQPLPSSQASRLAPSLMNSAPAANDWRYGGAYFDNNAQINGPAFDRQSGQVDQRQQSVKPSEATEQKNDDPFGAEEEVQQAAPQQPPQMAGNADFTERGNRYQQAAQQEFTKQQIGNYTLLGDRSASASPAIEYVSRPVWIGDELLLARRVDRDGQTFVQGSWLDWPRLKGELLAESADLLPDADLIPVRGDDEAEADPTRMLAGLPVKLVVGGPMASFPAAGRVDGPLQWALSFGWIALTLALSAVALLLWGVLALSERRAAFVSSVTHELRTPLTTFRLYADLLARDMAPTPERRREYVETLRTEAERLTHLVENVLSYARLERGRHPQRHERTTTAALVDRFEPRLAERTAQAGMTLTCNVEEASAGRPLTTDVGVVEQILFNLVDNAAKYAGRAADRRIALTTGRDGRFVTFTVRDFGPGFVSTKQASRSAPFSKSAQEAAETAPGVGLGLALCRRLAKELGGRLVIAPRDGEPGATVTLLLPAG